jgi:hypothetical protein
VNATNALNLASTLNGVTQLALVTAISTTPLMARESLNTQKDVRCDTSCEKLKVACLPATSLVNWPRLNNAEMFLNAQKIASSLLGALGLVTAQLVSVLVYLDLSKFVNDPSFRWVLEFAGAHDKSEFVTFHGAVKIAL